MLYTCTCTRIGTPHLHCNFESRIAFVHKVRFYPIPSSWKRMYINIKPYSKTSVPQNACGTSRSKVWQTDNGKSYPNVALYFAGATVTISFYVELHLILHSSPFLFMHQPLIKTYNLPCVFCWTNSFQTASVLLLRETVHHSTAK